MKNDELKKYLWDTIDELEEENSFLKFVIVVLIISVIALVMAIQYALLGSVI